MIRKIIVGTAAMAMVLAITATVGGSTTTTTATPTSPRTYEKLTMRSCATPLVNGRPSGPTVCDAPITQLTATGAVQAFGSTDNGQWHDNWDHSCLWLAQSGLGNCGGSALFSQDFWHGYLCDRFGDCAYDNHMTMQIVCGWLLNVNGAGGTACGPQARYGPFQNELGFLEDGGAPGCCEWGPAHFGTPTVWKSSIWLSYGYPPVCRGDLVGTMVIYDDGHYSYVGQWNNSWPC